MTRFILPVPPGDVKGVFVWQGAAVLHSARRGLQKEKKKEKEKKEMEKKEMEKKEMERDMRKDRRGSLQPLPKKGALQEMRL